MMVHKALNSPVSKWPPCDDFSMSMVQVTGVSGGAVGTANTVGTYYGGMRNLIFNKWKSLHNHTHHTNVIILDTHHSGTQGTEPRRHKEPMPRHDTNPDSWGTEHLERGKALWLMKDSSLFWGICIGDDKVLVCNWENNKIVGRKMLEERYGSLTVISQGACRVYSPEEIVMRAKQWQGKKFTEGSDGLDFVVWVITGLTERQAHGRGFDLAY